MIQPEELKNRLLEILKKQAFFKQKVILSSGKESSYYIDARLVTLTPEGAYLSAQIILDLIKDDDIQAIGGPTLGADPILGAIAVLSYQNKRPIKTFIIRKESKSHGRCRQIEGPALNKGDKVILIDDVATTGKSFIQAINILEKEGVQVTKIIVLIDRQEGAEENLKKQNCPFVSIFKASDFLK